MTRLAGDRAFRYDGVIAKAWLPKSNLTAGVHFPDGRGKTLWYRDGVFVRSRIPFQHQFQTALTRLADRRESGPFVRSATTKIEFPYGVVAELPEDARPETLILWRPSDQELAVNSLEPLVTTMRRA